MKKQAKKAPDLEIGGIYRILRLGVIFLVIERNDHSHKILVLAHEKQNNTAELFYPVGLTTSAPRIETEKIV